MGILIVASGKKKERNFSQLTPNTPHNRLARIEEAHTAGIPTTRRKSDTSSQNIFTRRHSKPGLSRRDSIFTHTSEVNIT